jgi:hypothetical protein
MAAKVRDYKITNSIGVYDLYKKIRKNHWYDIGRPLKEHEFYTIIRSINKQLAENIANGETVVFPEQMGKLELRKYPRGVSFVDGKLKNTYPIDWKSTNQLWAENEEEQQKRTLLRYESPMVYSVRYCKEDATYENKTFYQFRLHQKVRKKLKENIVNDKTDTLWLGR